MQPFAGGKMATRWGLPVVLLGVLALVVAIGGFQNLSSRADRRANDNPMPATGKTVRLTIDFGQRQRQFAEIPWREGMTVMDAMQAAASRPNGLAYKSRGTGPSAFVSSIEGVKNQGTGRNSKSWIYNVNDQQGKKSAGLRRLGPYDRILWKFQGWE